MAIEHFGGGNLFTSDGVNWKVVGNAIKNGVQGVEGLVQDADRLIAKMKAIAPPMPAPVAPRQPKIRSWEPPTTGSFFGLGDKAGKVNFDDGTVLHYTGKIATAWNNGNEVQADKYIEILRNQHPGEF